jgi:hypothetical protein
MCGRLIVIDTQLKPNTNMRHTIKKAVEVAALAGIVIMLATLIGILLAV